MAHTCHLAEFMQKETRAHSEDDVLMACPGSQENSFSQRVQLLSSTVANLFPLWLIFAALLSLWKPSLFLWFQKDYVTAGLAITMLSMGTSLTLEARFLPSPSLQPSFLPFPLFYEPL